MGGRATGFSVSAGAAGGKDADDNEQKDEQVKEKEGEVHCRCVSSGRLPHVNSGGRRSWLCGYARKDGRQGRGMALRPYRRPSGWSAATKMPLPWPVDEPDKDQHQEPDGKPGGADQEQVVHSESGWGLEEVLADNVAGRMDGSCGADFLPRRGTRLRIDACSDKRRLSSESLR